MTDSPLEPRVVRWPESEPAPDERQLRALLTKEGVAPYAWGNPPRDSYAPHRHAYHKIVFCLHGSITFEMPELGSSVELGPGDRLELPPRVLHSARVGDQGVTCLEAHRTHPGR